MWLVFLFHFPETKRKLFLKNYFTFNEKPDGNYDICPVCFWEDDPVQLQDPNYEGGANKVSLIQGQINFKKFGACEKEMVLHVRKPNKNELHGTD